MSGSAPAPTAKRESGTTAAEISVLIPQDTGVLLFARAVWLPPADDEMATDGISATAGVAWRRRPGTTPVVHAYAVNSAVDIPLCGSVFRNTGPFVELPPPPAHLGPYRRCKKCVAAVGRFV